MIFNFQKKENSKPLYIQLYEHIINEIYNGNIKSGHKLPSLREMSSVCNLSINTVINCYSQLETEGYISSVEKSGYYVLPLPEYFFIKDFSGSPTLFEENEKIYRNENVHPESLDIKTWKKMYSNQLFYNEAELYSSSHIKGEYILREAISEFINTFRGAKTVPEQIIVGAGIQSLLITLCILFKDFTEYAAFEKPGYEKARYVFQDFGYKTTDITVSGEGFSIPDMEKSDAGIVYVSPSHQYPTGSVMPVGKRMHLLEWAEKNDRYILEDDYDSIIRFESNPVPCLQGMDSNQRVVYIGSFSKLLSPAFRISYMALPASLLKKYDSLKNRYTQSASKLEQLALAEFIKEGHLYRHIRKIRRIYSEKNTLVAGFIEQLLKTKVTAVSSDSGLHMILDIITFKKYAEISNLLNVNRISSTLINSGYGYHRISLPYSGFTFDELENRRFSDVEE